MDENKKLEKMATRQNDGRTASSVMLYGGHTSVRFSSPNRFPFHPRMLLGCSPHQQSVGMLEMLKLFTCAKRKQPGKSGLDKSHRALQS